MGGWFLETEEHKDRFLRTDANAYCSTPQSLRDSSPASREQLFLETEEHKNRFLRVGCCFNDGLIRVLQTLDLVGVVCRGYRFALPSVIFSLCVPCFARFYKQIFTPSDLAVLGLVPLY